MDDDSPMPFGMHKGKVMGNVPAAYLLWLADEIKKGGPASKVQNEVKKYVDMNRKLLEMEVAEQSNDEE